MSLRMIAFIIFFTPLVSFAECPLGAKETDLTIQRAMRNFGRFIMYADHLSIKSKNFAETIEDVEIIEAIGKLDLVIACAEQILKDPTKEDVLPSKIHFMTDVKEKNELIDDYVYFMTDFKDAVTEYRGIFRNILTQKPSERNYSEAYEKYQDINNLVNRAHKKL